ncbi:FxsA family protein [Nocardioides humi]|uniref:Uncharacterized protein n=1 Tax=Nocardioides humi TaxID=449461 RepID=A0ABN2B835_9ACTN|nr:FxsA family protein [Nocardioides humi]
MSPATRRSRRARRITALVLLAVVALVVLELAVLVGVARLIGPWWTVLLLVLDTLLGAWLVKREGRRAWRALRERVETGRVPGRELADSVLVLLGGVLLISPGFLSDALGLLLVLPVTRPLFRGLLVAYAGRQVVRRTNVARPGPTVVRGEVIDEGE